MLRFCLITNRTLTPPHPPLRILYLLRFLHILSISLSTQDSRWVSIWLQDAHWLQRAELAWCGYALGEERGWAGEVHWQTLLILSRAWFFFFLLCSFVMPAHDGEWVYCHKLTAMSHTSYSRGVIQGTVTRNSKAIYPSLQHKKKSQLL